MDSVITVCTGHRCTALHQFTGAAVLPPLRVAVGASERAVLVSSGCVGACAQAPVVAVSAGRQAGGRLELSATTWLGPVGPAQVSALCEWVDQDDQDDQGARDDWLGRRHTTLPAMLADVAFDPRGLWVDAGPTTPAGS